MSPSRSWGFLIISVIVGNVLVFILIVPVEGVAYVGVFLLAVLVGELILWWVRIGMMSLL